MDEYLKPLTNAFEDLRNDEIAEWAKKYLKGKFEFYGIKSPERRETLKLFLQKYGFPDNMELMARTCWELPQREYQYFAMEVLNKRAKKAPENRIDLYEYMITTKSWWDTIDYIAANLVGTHFKKFPDQIKPRTDRWMKSGNIWLQRSSLLCQMRYKKETDLDLLTDYIRRLYGSKEFFINKAIGWVLREYSKTDANWVIDFVKQEENNLANLSKREALKWLERKQ